MASYISNTLRVSGLVSGIDVDQIVSDLMKAERTRVDKLYQQKQLVEWQQQDYRDMNLKLKALYDNVFNMKLQGTYLKYKTTGTMPSGVSSDNYFTAIAGSTAVPGDYKIQVKALATNAQITSSGSITKELIGNSISLPITIDSTKNKFEMIVDGIEKTITIAQGTYNDAASLATSIQNAVDGAYGAGKISVGSFSNSLIFSPDANYNHNISITLKDYTNIDESILGTLGFSNGATYKEIDPSKSIIDQRATFKNDPFGGSNPSDFIFTVSNGVNSKTFTFKSSDSINYILATISSDSTIKVSAYYDSLTDRVIFKSKETGTNVNIKIENTQGNLFGPSGAFNIASGASATGTNSSMVINGVTVENQSNNFTINGIQFNLRQAMTGTDTATLKVESDIDGVVANIKGFIEKYNETIDAINAKLSEERYRDYLPLTDEQKKDMKDTDIKLWEEKAKSGLLRSDPLLSGIVNKMRQALYTPVSGLRSDMDSLSEIGITTGGYWEKGKLHLDESKLRDALAKDPNAVAKLFTVFSDDKNTDNDGIAVRLYNVIKSGMDSITDKAGGGDYQLYDNSLLGKQVRDINDRISIMEDQLKSIEDRYYRQFTQMEQAIAAMNQQSMWLSQQLGMGAQG
ncbi:MAG: flagellar hook-associated protein 2 [Thermoanaerobacteraceae bacterium]|jgi:flagellar hook-associated protein 2|nr:flagellar hook-associated protein 2 [Thermoanaerobacteraceae bacterium]